MNNTPVLIAAMLVLAAGTFALRFAGPLLRSRVSFPPYAERIMEVSALVLLAALVATTALTEDHGTAGASRPIGVAVAGVLAWRKAPFLAVVLTAAAATAVLRLIGVD